MGAAEGWFLTLGDRRIALPVGEHVLGRSRDCDIVVRDPTVSRGHALVAVGRQRVTVQDLGSSNGVAINGQRVREETELAAGDQLRLGRVRLVLGRGAAPATADGEVCAVCGERVEPGSDPCPRCGAPLSADRPLSRSEAIGMSEVMAVGETLARPAHSLDDTLPPYPTSWEEPAPAETTAGERGAAELDEGPLAQDEPPPEVFDDPTSPVAVARAAEEDSPPPRGPLPPEEAQAAAEPAPDVPADREPAEAGGLYLPAAGFWVRAAAFSIDLAAPLLLALITGLAAGGWATAAGIGAGAAVGVVAWAALSIPFWMRRGDSPGKRLLALRVCDLDGRPGIGGGAAARRFAGYLLGVLSLGLGFVSAGLTAGRRGLHDRLAGTYVARVEESEAVAMIDRPR